MPHSAGNHVPHGMAVFQYPLVYSASTTGCTVLDDDLYLEGMCIGDAPFSSELQNFSEILSWNWAATYQQTMLTNSIR